MWIDVSSAAIVGMVAFSSATAKTPISTIVMGSELTGGYRLLAPMMIATVIAYAASGLNSRHIQEPGAVKEGIARPPGRL